MGRFVRNCHAGDGEHGEIGDISVTHAEDGYTHGLLKALVLSINNVLDGTTLINKKMNLIVVFNF